MVLNTVRCMVLCVCNKGVYLEYNMHPCDSFCPRAERVGQCRTLRLRSRNEDKTSRRFFLLTRSLRTSSSTFWISLSLSLTLSRLNLLFRRRTILTNPVCRSNHERAIRKIIVYSSSLICIFSEDNYLCARHRSRSLHGHLY